MRTTPQTELPCGHPDRNRCAFSTDRWLHCDACGGTWTMFDGTWVPDERTARRTA